MCIRKRLIIWAWCLVLVSACTQSASFEEEFALVIRAGRGKLSAEQQKELQRQQHVLSMQLADPSTLPLIRLFAQLTDARHQELLKQGYLKWKYAQLDKNSQAVFRSLVETNVNLAKKRGASPRPGFSVAALSKSEVGFAVVRLPENQQKVVSLFILWPTLSAPTWVTVVNARWCGTQSYFKAHLQYLPQLRQRPLSSLPTKKI